MDVIPYLEHIWCMLTVFILSPCIRGQFHQQSCDWIIRDDTEERGIRNVFGTCSEGEIMWLRPYGALRLVLNFGQTQNDFRGCIKSHIEFTKIKISQEGRYNLQNLVTLDVDHPEMEKELCFDSIGGKIVLYIEADTDNDSDAVTLGKAFINYALESKSIHLSHDELIECRPCTDKEILKAYCSSDFVVIGSMNKVFYDTDAAETEMTLSVSRVIRQKSQRFKRSADQRGKYNGKIIAPIKCNIRKGDGMFLFMGRMRLDRAILTCAPRWEQWQEIKRTSLDGENYECDLN